MANRYVLRYAYAGHELLLNSRIKHVIVHVHVCNVCMHRHWSRCVCDFWKMMNPSECDMYAPLKLQILHDFINVGRDNIHERM